MGCTREKTDQYTTAKSFMALYYYDLGALILKPELM